MFTKPPFTYFEIILLQIHFAKTTLGFSVFTKIHFFTCTFKFSKVSHKHTRALHLTNTYFTLLHPLHQLRGRECLLLLLGSRLQHSHGYASTVASRDTTPTSVLERCSLDSKGAQLSPRRHPRAG
jgi:hypothetical protein